MSGISDDEAFGSGMSLSQRAMGARATPYLDELNPAQREAVEALDGPVLMLAGAGTGKTRALTARIAHLMNTGRAQPNEILAVTFTNKAAREMKTRIGALMGQSIEGMRWLGTFHSVCVKLLRRHAELVGLQSNFTILDTDDQIRLIRQIMDAERIDRKKWTDRWVLSRISAYKDRAQTASWVVEHGSEVMERVVGAASDGTGHQRDIGSVYVPYQRRLSELNACDFGDLMLHMLTIFQTHPDVLEQYRRWFRYILVDEYQDTNVAQYLWLRLLAGGHQNICCVGDDDQSIYGWRGAEVGNILRFEKDFPGAKVIRLEQNYRSTAHILSAASAVISANTGRLGKTLWTEAEGGEKLRLIGHWDGDEEARWTGEEIEALQRGTRGLDPFSLDDMAILVRASHQMRAFEDRFLTIGLPYRVIGGPRFYERLEIRDAMAYFRLAVSPADDLAFERIVNTPRRGLGDKAQQTIQRRARAEGVSLLEGARSVCETREIGGKGLASLKELVASIDRWHGQVTAGAPHVELAEIILDASGYPQSYLREEETGELDGQGKPITKLVPRDMVASGRLENLQELVRSLQEHENLRGFLDHVSLVMENTVESEGDMVSIMTLHAAKGLEFPVVFLPGWEEGIFPSERSIHDHGPTGLEEERRLAYVGITRAERICTVSFATNRRVFGRWQGQAPSRFIDELPEEDVEVLTPPGLGAQAMDTYGESAAEARAMRADAYNSPGWKRMQARGAARGLSEPKEARNMIIDATAVTGFATGERVFHKKFGYGEIKSMEGDKLEIAFDKAGVKHVVARFIVAADKADNVPF